MLPMSKHHSPHHPKTPIDPKAPFPLSKDPNAAREAAKYDHPTASREYITTLIRELGPPMNGAEIADALGLSQDDDESLDVLEFRLRAMVRDGQLVLNRRGGLIPVDEKDLVRGRVSAHPDGFGFLVPDEGGDDLYIHAKQMDALFHGDHVVMRRAGKGRGGKTEGRLVEVLERGVTHVVGRLILEGGVAFVESENKRITQDVLVPLDKTLGATAGQVVRAEITHYPTRRHQAQGHVIETLGEHMAPGMEIDIAIHSHNLPNEFPEEVLEESNALGDVVDEADKQGRTDYRHLPLITIDGEDAKDFDDAVYAEANEQGWRLYVAIADVSHYVKPQSPLDQEAAKRATSVYFPGRVIPMLPESLSNGLCSLNPHVDRLCMMCEMQIDKNGQLVHFDFKEGVFQSQARTTYTQVGKILLEQDEATRQQFEQVVPHIEELHRLYKALRRSREERGAIDFDTVETRIVFGDDKKIEAIVPVQRHDAHKLIEECMVTANIAAAKYLDKHEMPALFRVHDEPAEEKYEELREFLMSFAISLPAATKPDVKLYADIASKAAGRPESELITTVLLRSMKQAQYRAECKGHFGLALSHYAHFTSPIRRYPDLLVHRAIRHILRGGSKADYRYDEGDMAVLGEVCSSNERRADEATRDATDWLKCEYMMDKVGETYEATITGVAPFGIFAQLKGVYVEGMVHVTNLEKDYFDYDPVGHRLIGQRTGQLYRLSDTIKVTVDSVNLDDRKIDLSIAEPKKRAAGKRPVDDQERDS
ncbi:ribonuclease R [gamma proteobacterium HTCC5015]|nr:ribonuclease R [gamma proteobacterium HTCC5015]